MEIAALNIGPNILGNKVHASKIPTIPIIGFESHSIYRCAALVGRATRMAVLPSSGGAGIKLNVPRSKFKVNNMLRNEAKPPRGLPSGAPNSWAIC